MDKYEQAVWLKLRDKANEAGVTGNHGILEEL